MDILPVPLSADEWRHLRNHARWLRITPLVLARSILRRWLVETHDPLADPAADHMRAVRHPIAPEP